MSNTKLDDDLVLSLASDGMTNTDIAAQLECDEASIRRSHKRTGFKRHLLPLNLEQRWLVHMDTPIVLRNQDAMITADWHIPLYNPALVNKMITTAVEKGIKTLVIGGDFWNFDALSAYDPKQPEGNLTREWKEGLAVMRTIAETFDDIVFVWGNHDYRFHKALGHAMSFVNSMKMTFGLLGDDVLSKIRFTNLDNCWLLYGEPVVSEEDGERMGLMEWERYLPRQRWNVCHPQSYSRVPLTSARQLCAKLQSNVITAHSHHAALGYGTDGVLVAAEAGGLHEHRKTTYLQRSTTFPRWQNGFGYLQSGHFQLVTGQFGQ